MFVLPSGTVTLLLGDVEGLVAPASLTVDLTLVTADTQLIECSWLKTLPN